MGALALVLGVAFSQTAAAEPATPEKPAPAAVKKAAPGKKALPRVVRKRSPIEKPPLKPAGKGRQRWPTERPKTLPADFGIPPMGQVPFPEGERLVFSVQMLGAVAGEVMLGVGKRQQSDDGRWVLPIAGWIRSSDFLTRFYPVSDHLTVDIDLKSFLPIRSSFFIREKDKVVDYHTAFDHGDKRIDSRKVSDGREEKPLLRNFTTTGPMIDTLTSVYAARRLELVPGKTFSYYAWDGRKERLVSVTMVKVEKVWTPIGWYEAMRLDVTTQVTGGFIEAAVLKWKPMRGQAWIGLDPQRTPVKLVSPTKLGDATALLQRRFIEPGDLGPQARTEANP